MKRIRIYLVIAVLGAASTLVSCCATKTTPSTPNKPVPEGKEGPAPQVANPGPRYGTGQ
jgi:hypothetical protein